MIDVSHKYLMNTHFILYYTIIISSKLFYWRHIFFFKFMLMLKACGWNREFQFDKNWNTCTQVILELRKMACYYIDSRSYQRYNSYLVFQYIRLTLSSNNFHPSTILSLNQTKLRVHLTFLIWEFWL